MMKQRIAVTMACMAVVTALTSLVIAEEHPQGMKQGKMMQGQEEMSGKKDMIKDMPMMQCPMMGGMMKRQVVAADDGGVFIVVGNLLLKYDKDLKLVKKTTIEIADEDMKQMMTKMKKHCGMCRKACRQMMEDEEGEQTEE